MTPRRIALTLALTGTAALAGGAAPAAAQDVCITYDFAGSELCVLAETARTVETARQVLRDNDQCVTYDFAGSELCVIRDTIG